MSKYVGCPFCGSEAHFEEDYDHHGGHFTLGCPIRDCPGHWAYYTEPIENLEKATKAWNTRAEKINA